MTWAFTDFGWRYTRPSSKVRSIGGLKIAHTQKLNHWAAIFLRFSLSLPFSRSWEGSRWFLGAGNTSSIQLGIYSARGLGKHCAQSSIKRLNLRLRDTKKVNWNKGQENISQAALHAQHIQWHHFRSRSGVCTWIFPWLLSAYPIKRFVKNTSHRNHRKKTTCNWTAPNLHHATHHATPSHRLW